MHVWRRSYDVPPPGGESLKDTLARTLPYYVQEILPCVLRGERTLVAAHGNSLRALIMVLEKLSPEGNSDARTRHRRAGDLPAQCRRHGGLEARSGGVSAKAEIVALDAPVARYPRSISCAAVLVDCVEGGASVSFMSPYSHADALAFFRKVATSVASGDAVLLAARLAGKIVGTVQLGLDTPPNQPHRADLQEDAGASLRAAARGVGAALMAQVEEEARRRGRWLLVPRYRARRKRLSPLSPRRLDRKSAAFRTTPLFPDGRLCDTAIIWKRWLDRERDRRRGSRPSNSRVRGSASPRMTC